MKEPNQKQCQMNCQCDNYPQKMGIKFTVCIDDNDSEISSEQTLSDFVIDIQNHVNINIEVDQEDSGDVYINYDMISVSSDNSQICQDKPQIMRQQMQQVNQEIKQKQVNEKKNKAQRIRQKKSQKKKVSQLANNYALNKKIIQNLLNIPQKLVTNSQNTPKDNILIPSHKNLIHFNPNYIKPNRQLNFILRIVSLGTQYAQTLAKLQKQNITIPTNFQTIQQYQNVIKAAYEIQSLYNIIQIVNKIKKNPQSSQFFQLKSIDQHFRSDQIYESEIKLLYENNPQQVYKFSKIFDQSTKFRLGLVVIDNDFNKSFIVGFVQPSRNQNKSSLILLSKISIAQKSTIYLYDIDYFVTDVRNYAAILNTRHSVLMPQILAPNKYEKIYEQSHQFNQLEILLHHLCHNFNKSQLQCITKISRKQSGIHLLQGPPGTGKTSTLVGILSCEYIKLSHFGQYNQSLSPKILICTPSNSAADHIAKKIVENGLYSPFFNRKKKPPILRIGLCESPQIQNISINFIIKKITQISYVKQRIKYQQLQEWANTLQKEAKQLEQDYNLNYYAVQYKRWLQGIFRNILKKHLKNSSIFLKQLLKKVQKSFINGASIIISTLSSCVLEKLACCHPNFTCVIIDQACQSTQPSTLIPLQYGMAKMILIGDPNQLPATKSNPISAKNGYCRSMFERFVDAGVKPHFLQIQYRMNPLIREFPSQYFYQNKLQDSDECKSRKNNDLTFLKSKQVVFIACVNSRQTKIGNSYSNLQENRVIKFIISKIEKSNLSIGVISPYQGQCQLIKKGLSDTATNNITVSTVDSYQGQQRDVIIISTVRSNEEQNLGFITDPQRTNVALTRAKRALYVVGNPYTLCKSKLWKDYMKWVRQKATYFTYDGMKSQISVLNRIID